MRTWRGALEVLPAVVAAGLLVGMLWLTRRSLEILDESYLLRLIADPQATRPAGDVYLFGFVLHPLWELVGRDVALFRAVGIVALGLAAAWLNLEGIALLREGGVDVPGRHVVVSCLVCAASSVVVLSFNVMVPAYRSVTLAGIILVAGGAARALRGRRAVGGLLVGVGGWTCFVGKPTSALALALVVGLFLVACRLVSLHLVGATVGGMLLAATATLAMARMTPVDVVDYLAGGARSVEILGDHPNLRVVLGLSEVNLQGLVVLGPLLLLPVLAATAFRDGRSPVGQQVVDSAGVVGVLGAGAAAAAIGSAVMGPLRTGWQVLSLGWLVPLLVVVQLVRQRRAGHPPAAGLQAWGLLLLVVPYAGAVGSNLPFGAVVPLMLVPWVVAAVQLVLAGAGSRRAVPSFAVAMALLASLTGVMAWVVHTNSPTGGDLARGLQWAPVAGGALQLDGRDARAARQLREVSGREGVTPSTPVVDLTGVGAGYAFMTGGRPLGRAHLYSYQPRSLDAAAYAIGTESCRDRASAWLLVRGEGATPLAGAMFVDGVDRDDYDLRLRFVGRWLDQRLDLELLEPRPSVATKYGC